MAAQILTVLECISPPVRFEETKSPLLAQLSPLKEQRATPWTDLKLATLMGISSTEIFQFKREEIMREK